MKWKRLILVILFWISIGTAHFIAIYFDSQKIGYKFNSSINMYAVFISAYLSWSILTLSLFYIFEKFLSFIEIKSRIFLYFFGILIWLPIFSIFDYISVHIFIEQHAQKPISEIILEKNPFSWFLNIIIYSLNYGACLAIVFFQQFKEESQKSLKLQKIKSDIEIKSTIYQMQALQSQLSPHFLFNALNTISSFGRTGDNKNVVSTTAKLADLLRYAVEASKNTKTTINEELTFTQNYIDMQYIRFGERYQCKIHSNLKHHSFLCPPFCIHPLVENAYAHSLSDADQSIAIDINLFCRDKHIEIIVTNTLLSSPKNHGLGTGLTNLSERLHLMYREKASLTYITKENNFICMLCIPKEE